MEDVTMDLTGFKKVFEADGFKETSEGVFTREFTDNQTVIINGVQKNIEGPKNTIEYRFVGEAFASTVGKDDEETLAQFDMYVNGEMATSLITDEFLLKKIFGIA